MADGKDKDVEAAINVTLQEMEDILETYEMIESKDIETDQGISRQTVSEGEKKDQDVERTTEEFAVGDKHNCGSMTVENLVRSSELQNVEPEALNPKMQNNSLTGKENGTVLAVVGEIGSEEFQTSNSEEGTASTTTGSKAGELTDTEGNPSAGKDDQNYASGFQTDTTTRSTKTADVNTGNVGSEMPKAENATLDSKGNALEMRADTTEGPVTVVEVEQEPNLDFQDDTLGDILKRTMEGKVENGSVEKPDTKSVENQTTASLILSMSETKSTQTEEIVVTEGGIFIGAVGEDFRRFQDKEVNDSKPKNEITGQENSNEMQKPTRELGVPNGCETQTNKLKESTETISNTLPRPTEEGDRTVTQCSGPSDKDVPNGVKPKDVRDITRDSQVNCPEVEIAEEVTVESIYETKPKTFQETVRGTVQRDSDDNPAVANPLKKRQTPAELAETLRNLRLGNSCSTDSDGRRNPTEIYAKQAGETEGGSILPVVKHPFAYRSAFQEDKRHEGPSLIARSKLRTLEDCLNAFDLFPRLLKLEESLEKVRRGKRTTTEHEADCKSLDKELVRLSREHHPDSVMKRGGSEEKMTRANEIQTALNAARTVLNILNKIFLEDIDIEHKYRFFTRLEIVMLGNEDEVGKHAYQVLLKIILVSEIKQESIVGEVRRFLEAAHLCVDSYAKNKVPDFMKHRHSVFFYLKRCITGYQKLHAELSYVATECLEEKLRNIFPLIQRMKLDCGKQLEYLEGLLQLTQRPFGEIFPMYRNGVNDCFVRPLDCYVNVIMACSVMIKNGEDKGLLKSFVKFLKDDRNPSSIYGINQSSILHAKAGEGDAIGLLNKLASYYAGHKQYRTFVEDLLRKDYVTKDDVKGQFLVRLTEVIHDLKTEFKPEDYIAKRTNKYILKELKLCREMKEEFETKKKEVVEGLKEMNKNYESMTDRLDKLLRDQERLSRELSEQLSDVKMQKEEIERYSRKKAAN